VAGSLAVIVRSYKASVARQINAIRQTPGEPVWQRNYYEHVIRHEADLNRIREYIAYNPARWSEDDYFAS
jgi:REP element-mobilizing transposase RayT